MKPGIAAVVLAGGESRRFEKGDKALAEHEGEPFIRKVVRQLDRAFNPIPIVSVRSPVQRIQIERVLDRDVRWVYDPLDLKGPVAGVAAAASETQQNHLFVAACDLPLIDIDTITALSSQRSSDVDGVVPVVSGRLQPLHAVYGTQSVIEAIRETRCESMMEVIQELNRIERVCPQDLENMESLERSVENINTVEALERVENEKQSVDRLSQRTTGYQPRW